MSNKIRKISRLSCYAFLIILLASCGKELEQFTPQDPTGVVDDIYANFTTESEEFTLDVQDKYVIETQKNTLIVVKKDDLILNSGNAITDKITIRIQEISDKADMIKNNLSTTTSTDFLISERMIKIEIESNGNEVKLKPGSNYNIYIPNTQPKEKMNLFYGIMEFETVIWEEAENDRAIEINEWFFQTQNGVIADFGYILNCDRFDWINVDIYYETPADQKIEVSVELPEVLYNGKNTIVFMVFENENSAVRLSYNESTRKFYEPYGATPKGHDINIVIISSISENDFHFGIKKFSTAFNINSFMVPESMGKSAIEEKLKEL
jgi:hypothetical protein